MGQQELHTDLETPPTTAMALLFPSPGLGSIRSAQQDDKGLKTFDGLSKDTLMSQERPSVSTCEIGNHLLKVFSSVMDKPLRLKESVFEELHDYA